MIGVSQSGIAYWLTLTLRVHRYVDDTLALFHGPLKLAAHEAKGHPLNTKKVVPLLAA